MSPMIFGCVSDSRSLLPLRSRRPILEALAAVIGLAQLVALDHGAHGAVQDQDALFQEIGEFVHVLRGESGTGR